MNVKCISVLIALVCVITAGSVQTAIGAQFDSTLNPSEKESEFRILYQKTLLIDYESGGDIARQMSGPAAEYMKAAGIEPSALGLSRMYSSVCGHMIIDTKDKKLSTKIREQEMKVYETKITMKTLEAEEALASFMIKQVKI